MRKSSKIKIFIFALFAALLLAAIPIAVDFLSQKNGDLIEFDGPTVLFLSRDGADFDRETAFWRGVLSFFGDSVENPQNEGAFYEKKSVVQGEETQILSENYKKWDLICASGNEFCKILANLAGKFPEQKFAFFDADFPCELQNAEAFSFSQEESAFLCGILAAQKLKKIKDAHPKIAILMCKNDSATKKRVYGFAQGVLQCMSGAEFEPFFCAESSEKNIAKSAFDLNAEIIFIANRELCGAAIETSQESAYENRAACLICADDEKNFLRQIHVENPAILTSALICPEIIPRLVLSQLKNKKFQSGNAKVGLAHRAVDFSRSNNFFDNKDFSVADEFADKIINQKIDIISDDNDYFFNAVIPQEIIAAFDNAEK